MSREILFRAKSKSTGEWQYGYYVEQYGVGQIFTDRASECVHKSTIGQYTGLTDKNGIKIFEGDIVLKEYWDRPYSRKAKSKFLKGIVQYHIREGNGFGKGDEYKCWAAEWDVEIVDKESERKYSCHSWGCFFECEVIGNIHDNPELLET